MPAYLGDGSQKASEEGEALYLPSRNEDDCDFSARKEGRI